MCECGEKAQNVVDGFPMCDNCMDDYLEDNPQAAESVYPIGE